MSQRGVLRNIKKLMLLIGLKNKDRVALSFCLYSFLLKWPLVTRTLPLGLFGRTITNPPSTPHFIIRPDQTTTALTTGIESEAEILEQLTQISGG